MTEARQQMTEDRSQTADDRRQRDLNAECGIKKGQNA